LILVFPTSRKCIVHPHSIKTRKINQQKSITAPSLFVFAKAAGGQAAGALSDLEIGKNISVNGTANSDGSVTAQIIQLRPLDRNQ